METGIDVICDFRAKDMALGGQGAPLVPAFHQAVFGSPKGPRMILNIGGIANVSVLPGPDDQVFGFDTGPGNTLMDQWYRKHKGGSYDPKGAWAASGQINADLLAALLAEPYFAQAAPKSTGRDLFNPAWLAEKLKPFPHLQPADVQATLTELTARCCADSTKRYSSDSKVLIVCGGGAFNGHLMARLQACLPTLQVCSSQACGLPPLQVEASAFAWLARKTVRRETASPPAVTGAHGARILGAIYPA